MISLSSYTHLALQLYSHIHIKFVWDFLQHNEEAKIAKEVEAHERRIRKELEKQDILNRKVLPVLYNCRSVFLVKFIYDVMSVQREEQRRKEMERLDRERRKEEERLLRERQREEERFQREQRREHERLEKFLQKQSKRVSFLVLRMLTVNVVY